MTDDLGHSEGLSPANMEILEEIASIIAAYKGPWILAADFNMEPAMIATSGWLELTDGHICRPEASTCGVS